MSSNLKYDLIPHPSGLLRLRAIAPIGAVAVGDLGGLVESEYNLSREGRCWVSENAHVSGRARVAGDAQVLGNARVAGDANVLGNANVVGRSQVFGNACVSGYAYVAGAAQVCGNTYVSGNAVVIGNAQVSGDAHVSGHARVLGNARVSGKARVFGNVSIFGDAYVLGFLPFANRSDGFTFAIAKSGARGLAIMAGCRFFTISEARAHWLITRGGTRLGDESLALVDYLERMAMISGLLEGE